MNSVVGVNPDDDIVDWISSSTRITVPTVVPTKSDSDVYFVYNC